MTQRRRQRRAVAPTPLYEVFAALPPMTNGVPVPNFTEITADDLLNLVAAMQRNENAFNAAGQGLSPNHNEDVMDGYAELGMRTTVTGRTVRDVPPIQNIAPPQRRHEQMATSERGTVMANNILLETGQKQERQASSLIFFVYVTPTGAEVSMGKCPHVRRTWGRSEGGFEGTSRLQRTEYQVLAPITIKMVNIATTFGSAKRHVQIFLDLDPGHAAIDFNALDGFGSFKGRAKINFKKSSFREHTTAQNLNEECMREIFNLKVLQPARVQGKSKVRSLIF
jgi:hypothetical protein